MPLPAKTTQSVENHFYGKNIHALPLPSHHEQCSKIKWC